MKKFVNDPKDFVPEMLQGDRAGEPGHAEVRARVQPDHADRCAERRQGVDRAGSGSGHEPAHVMIVGKGMLDAACPGDVFAAPPMDYVLETTKLLNSPKGVLHLVNNYTGDRMAFDMGRRWPRPRASPSRRCSSMTTSPCKDSTYTVGRRGVAGNFFVIKAVGAASEQGADLDELVRARRAGQRGDPHDGHGAHRRARRPRRARRCSSWATTRWRWASDPRRAGPPPREAGRARTTIVDELVEAIAVRPAVRRRATTSR